MIRSMTAYGKAIFTSSLGKWVVEIHSINKKNLELNVFIPRECLAFDVEVRKQLCCFLHRGQVTLKMSFQPTQGVFIGGMEPWLSFKRKMEEMALALGFPLEQITLPFFYEESKGLPKEFAEGQEKQVGEDLQEALQRVLVPFLAMKQTEGRALAEAFQEHLEQLEKSLVQIEEKKGSIAEKYRKKLLEKLQEVKEISLEDQNQVLREVFLYVEKGDVSEEITRLHSHIHQFRALLHSQEKGSGKILEFLTQEMAREANTISSKVGDLDLSWIALKMKSEVEKIREQVQNVE
ncbi:MAG: DUF1732 domain-containing protein [Chlamydiae bacterium]|nr:DUF1732 domain-containing protein [Chlamydiota bacterium]